MANLAIIPARGGSKRIPRKNIKPFLGKPIIAYSIEAALKSNLFNEVMVSTDDDEIAKIAIDYGAIVPFLRSNNNANDFATLADVIIEVLNKFKKIGKEFESVCCILPTAALITPKLLKKAYSVLYKKDLISIVPVIKYAYPIQRALKSSDGLLKMIAPINLTVRSQDLEDSYHDSGQFYWLKTNEFIKEKSIFNSKTGFIELKEHEAQDVDTLDDWDMLHIKYNYKNLDNNGS